MHDQKLFILNSVSVPECHRLGNRVNVLCISPIRNQLQLFPQYPAGRQFFNKWLAQTDNGLGFAINKSFYSARKVNKYSLVQNSGCQRGFGCEIRQFDEVRLAMNLCADICRKRQSWGRRDAIDGGTLNGGESGREEN